MNYRNKIKNSINVNYKKNKKTSKLQKKKQYELDRRRALLRNQNVSNKEKKQTERKQKRENVVEASS